MTKSSPYAAGGMKLTDSFDALLVFFVMAICLAALAGLAMVLLG